MYALTPDLIIKLWVWFVVRLVLWLKAAIANGRQGSLVLRTRTGVKYFYGCNFLLSACLLCRYLFFFQGMRVGF